MQPHCSWDCKEKISFLISHALSLLLTFKLSFFSPLFLPHSLLSSSHSESFSSFSILAFGLQIGVAQIGVKALGGWDSNRYGLPRVLGLVVVGSWGCG